MKMKQLSTILSTMAILGSIPAFACTGISLRSIDGSKVIARTIEWGGSNLNSLYVIVPRGHTQISLTPEGFNGKQFTSRYGYVGLAVESKEYIEKAVRTGIIDGYPDGTFNPEAHVTREQLAVVISKLIDKFKYF